MRWRGKTSPSALYQPFSFVKPEPSSAGPDGLPQRLRMAGNCSLDRLQLAKSGRLTCE